MPSLLFCLRGLAGLGQSRGHPDRDPPQVRGLQVARVSPPIGGFVGVPVGDGQQCGAPGRECRVLGAIGGQGPGNLPEPVAGRVLPAGPARVVVDARQQVVAVVIVAVKGRAAYSSSRLQAGSSPSSVRSIPPDTTPGPQSISQCQMSTRLGWLPAGPHMGSRSRVDGPTAGRRSPTRGGRLAWR